MKASQFTDTRKPVSRLDVYRTLTSLVSLGNAVRRGTAFPDEHAAIVTLAAWDGAQAVLNVNPRVRVQPTEYPSSKASHGQQV